MTTSTTEQRRQFRRLQKKQTFWKHVTVYALVNAGFWISWIIGGVTDRWLAPWPLLPTIAWGLFILAYEYRLGGPEAISHDTMAAEKDALLHPERVDHDPNFVPQPIMFGDFREYTPLRPFKWRDVLDLRDTRAGNTPAADSPSADTAANA